VSSFLTAHQHSIHPIQSARLQEVLIGGIRDMIKLYGIWSQADWALLKAVWWITEERQKVIMITFIVLFSVNMCLGRLLNAVLQLIASDPSGRPQTW